MKISKAKRAHLIERMTAETRQQDYARFMRRICARAMGTAVLPQDATFEIVSFGSAGGPMALFKAEMDRAGVAIAMALLGSTP